MAFAILGGFVLFQEWFVATCEAFNLGAVSSWRLEGPGGLSQCKWRGSKRTESHP